MTQINGTADNDVLNGTEENDVIDGKSGVDKMSGGKLNDIYYVDNSKDSVIERAKEGFDLVFSQVNFTLGANVEQLILQGTNDLDGIGNAQANYIFGNTGNNKIDCGAGDDTLDGNDGDDILIGGSGNDVITGGAGADLLIGGTGNDRYEFNDPFHIVGDVIVEAANGGIDTISATFSVDLNAFSNIENLNLQAAAATGVGNALNNFIVGNTAGNDLYGNAGNDTLDGGGGGDNLSGGIGNDIYIVDSAFDHVIENLGEGIDELRAGLSVDLLNYKNVEIVTLLEGGDFGAIGDAAANLIIGNSGINDLQGGAGDDTLNGGGGNDLLDGGLGNDKLSGGAGDDQYTIDSNKDVIAELVNNGYDTIYTTIGYSSLNYTLAANVEEIFFHALGTADVNGKGNVLANQMGGTAGKNTLDGGAGNDFIQGNNGDDSLFGGVGDDKLDGGFGNDTLNGGAGNDIYVIHDATETVLEAANGGIDTVISTISATLENFKNVEKLLLVGPGNLRGDGNLLNNLIQGNDGNNYLLGHAGNDILDGGVGNDTLEGGIGNDIYIIDSAMDIITENAGEGIDEIRASVNIDLDDYQNVEILTFLEGGNLDAFGDGRANTIYGNSGINDLRGGDGDDTLIGGGGSDILDGGAGNDKMAGGAGDDQYTIDSAKDVITELANNGYDTVFTTVSYSSLNYTLGANVEDIFFHALGTADVNGTGNSLANHMGGTAGKNKLDGGAGNDFIEGNNGDDNLIGGTGDDTLGGGLGNDTLNGGAGNDRIEGGFGADNLTGGAGNDIFFYNISIPGDLNSIGGDTITDFKHGQDKIDVSDLFRDFGINIPMGGSVDGFLRLEAITGTQDVALKFDSNGGADTFVTLATLHNASSATIASDVLFA